MSDQATAATPQQTDDQTLTGIGGWLILMAFGQVMGPIKFFVSLIEYYGSIESRIIQSLPLTIAGEALMNAVLGAIWIYTAILFFRKSKRFPKFFVVEIIAMVIAIPFSAAWVTLGVFIETGRFVGTSMLTAFEPLELAKMIGSIVFGGIWIVYLKKSRRVANTFVH